MKKENTRAIQKNKVNQKLAISFIVCYPILFFLNNFSNEILQRLLLLICYAICHLAIILLLLIFLDTDIINGLEFSKRFKDKSLSEKKLIFETFKSCFCIALITIFVMSIPPIEKFENGKGITIFFQIATILLCSILFGTTISDELDKINLFFIENPLCPICKESGEIIENTIVSEKVFRRNVDDFPEKYFYKISYFYQCHNCKHKWGNLVEINTKRCLLLENKDKGINLIWKFDLH